MDLRAGGRLAESEPYLVEANEVSREAGGADNLRRTDFLLALSELRLEQARFPQAEELAREAVAVRRKKLGAEDWRTGETLVVWGQGLERLGRCREGVAAVRRGTELIRAKAPGPVQARLTRLRESCRG
jgi:hypothetical protein